MLKKAKIILINDPNTNLGIISLSDKFSFEQSDNSINFHSTIIVPGIVYTHDYYIEKGIIKKNLNAEFEITEEDFLNYKGKVVSSSDEEYNLPTTSEKFLIMLVNNRNNFNEEDLKDILVEYNSDGTIRIKPDNTITIKKVRENWDREEFIEIINLFAKKFIGDSPEKQKEVSDWVAIHLK